ncbi:MAG: S8 family serine peptidase [Caldilineaceae bacterium]
MSPYPYYLFHTGRWYIIVVVTLALLAWPTTPSYAKNKDAATIPGQIVVKLDPLSGATIDAINQSYGTTTLRDILASRGIYLLQTTGDTHAIIEQMKTDLRLLYAELNYIGQSPEDAGRKSWASGGADPGPRAGQYAARMLNLPAAHAITQGAGTVVAVLDTGIDANHPVLAPMLTADRYDFVDDDTVPDDTKDGIDNDGDGYVDDAWAHGTHVAGLVNLAAPQARIMPLRVLDADGNGDYFTLAEAIQYAVEHGANVINLSVGSEAKSELLKDAVSGATQRGVVVVAAAGNNNGREQQYPGGTQCALAVTAIDEAGHKADFANYGGWVHLAAPGVSIYSTVPTGEYAWWSGTSMATPLVAGEAALLRSVNSTVSVRSIATLLAETAHSLDSANPDYRGQLGVGLPDVTTALQRLRNGDIPGGGGVIPGSCSGE